VAVKLPPKLPLYVALTVTTAVPTVGKLQTVEAPVAGAQLASEDVHWISAGAPGQPAASDDENPTWIGVPGTAVMLHLGGAFTFML